MTAAPFTHERYRGFLRAGLAAGYRFESFAEIDALRRLDVPVCLLRHDCDNDLVAAAALAAIEAELGVRSTYFLMLRSAMYNLLAPTNAALVRRILGAGHWLGLHFDESLVADDPPDRVAGRVDSERALLQQEFGVAIPVVSFHQPSERVLAGQIKLGCLSTYDREDMAGFHYTSDSNLSFRGGEPSELLASRQHLRLQILLHPEWWTREAMPLSEKWQLMLSNNLDLAQDSLLRREATFNTRLVLRFEASRDQAR